MLRNLNEPAPDADAMLQNLFTSPEGREKIRASIIQPILNRLAYRSGWLEIFTLVGPDEDVEQSCWELEHEVPLLLHTSFLADHIVQSLVAGFDARVGVAFQSEFTVGEFVAGPIEDPGIPLPCTLEAWEEARADQTRVLMGPETFNRLRTQDWFMRRWNPSVAMERTQVGMFGIYGDSLSLRVTRYMPTDRLLFTNGPVGKVKLGLALTEHVSEAGFARYKWRGVLTVSTALDGEIRLRRLSP